MREPQRKLSRTELVNNTPCRADNGSASEDVQAQREKARDLVAGDLAEQGTIQRIDSRKLTAAVKLIGDIESLEFKLRWHHEDWKSASGDLKDELLEAARALLAEHGSCVDQVTALKRELPGGMEAKTLKAEHWRAWPVGVGADESRN